MGYVREELKEEFNKHRDKILENVETGKSMGMNKITIILALDDETEEIQGGLINWLIFEGYKVALKRDEYNILSVEW